MGVCKIRQGTVHADTSTAHHAHDWLDSNGITVHPRAVHAGTRYKHTYDIMTERMGDTALSRAAVDAGQPPAVLSGKLIGSAQSRRSRHAQPPATRLIYMDIYRLAFAQLYAPSSLAYLLHQSRRRDLAAQGRGSSRRRDACCLGTPGEPCGSLHGTNGCNHVCDDRTSS